MEKRKIAIATEKNYYYYYYYYYYYNKVVDTSATKEGSHEHLTLRWQGKK